MTQNYKCSKCNTPVFMIDGIAKKACKCEASITAEMQAVVYGKSILNKTNEHIKS